MERMPVTNPLKEVRTPDEDTLPSSLSDYIMYSIAVKNQTVKAWILLSALSLGLCWTYLLDILLLDHYVWGFRVRLPYLMLVCVVNFGFIDWTIKRLVKRQILTVPRLQNLCLIVTVCLSGMIFVDVVSTVRLNALGISDTSPESRMDDPHLSSAELWPRSFFPTNKNFKLLKPRATLSGEQYGQLYLGRLMKSSTLAESVFQLKHVSFSIDEYGFRETVPPHDANTFALGDSFVFGYSVDQSKTWVKVLEGMIGRPVYNLGICGASPKQELMLLEYVLQRHPESFKIRHLLWMIYEGNDLEDDYATYRDTSPPKDGLLSGTILQGVCALPFAMQNESVIRKLTTGKINLVSPRPTRGFDPYHVDGVTLLFPLYHSRMFGYRLFDDLNQVLKPKSYILNHPNRPLLEQVFKEMAELSRRSQFDVTVLVAPSAAWLYAPYFENFPSIPVQPFFVDYVAGLSNLEGFKVLNLLTLMQRYAEKELLYFRDDAHWTERGHEIVARIVAQELFQRKHSDTHDMALGD